MLLLLLHNCAGALGTVAKCSIARYSSTATCRPFFNCTPSTLLQQQHNFVTNRSATRGARSFSTASSSSTKQLLHTATTGRKSAEAAQYSAYEQDADVQNNNSGSGHTEPAAVGADSSAKNGLVGAKNILQSVLPTPGLSGDALFGPRPDIW
jgi:hypothetical protein